MEDNAKSESSSSKSFTSVPRDWGTMSEQEKTDWAENFLTGSGLFPPKTPQVETKWFLGKDSQGVFAVYKAEFEDSIITNEKQWLIPNRNIGWRDTKSVMDWFFIGEDSLWPCTYQEALEYLPIEALDMEEGLNS